MHVQPSIPAVPQGRSFVSTGMSFLLWEDVVFVWSKDICGYVGPKRDKLDVFNGRCRDFKLRQIFSAMRTFRAMRMF